MNTTNTDGLRGLDEDPDLDRMLGAAARPSTGLTPEVRSRLAAMAESAMAPDRPSHRRRAALAAAVLAPVLLVGGAGAAFAATMVDWSQFWGTSTSATTEWQAWAEDPDAIVTYSLPGGGACELRLGDVTYSPDPARPDGVEADPRSADAVRDYLRAGDLFTEADVENAIVSGRVVDENFIEEDDGSRTRFGYGTENYDADVEYNMAVTSAIQNRMTEYVEGRGLPMVGVGWSGQEKCTGVDE
ncbi:hypothetical protein BJY17_002259 [Agromyces hippuratus]|uniref:Uncharacterized protein n=2 Tax=Agromyces hippuratus TaxID=286438 RepID=A0A852WTC4_9MICO|nr:hypothetical protein [Agromyces hippuratus]NYG21512.1 hypothetical protein [Agromyces hippuratus]